MPQYTAAPSSTSAGTGAKSPPFACAWHRAGYDAAWVHVVGELDLATSWQLRNALRQAQLRARMIVLNLRELTFIDSSGIHAALDAAACAEEHGGHLLVVRGPEVVDRMFTLTRAFEQILICDLDTTEPVNHRETAA